MLRLSFQIMRPGVLVKSEPGMRLLANVCLLIKLGLPQHI